MTATLCLLAFLAQLLFLCLVVRKGADSYLNTLARSGNITNNNELRWATRAYDYATRIARAVGVALVALSALTMLTLGWGW